jgi:sigma-B regulation protein RsbU (phosphoserine phosphatase)
MAVGNTRVREAVRPHRISCSEIWGGIRNVDVDVATSALNTSIYSHSCQGGKGGDIYFLSVCDTDKLTRIAVADVVGHGQVVSAMSEWVYDALATRMNDPAGGDLLEDLNHKVIERGLAAMTTAAIISFYRDDSRMYVAYAGHPPLLMRRSDEADWRVAGSQPLRDRWNLPLGIQDRVEFVQDQFAVGRGDRLVAYTDGLTEARGPMRELFGQRRLLEALQSAGDCEPPLLKHRVLEVVRRHTGGELEHDDVTLLAIEIR